jgi:hypothetical protein
MNIKSAIAKRPSVFLMTVVLAMGITLATFFYQRSGPFMGEYGNTCGPVDSGQLCIAPVLQAGWPLPYVFDVPTVSVPHKLYAEDEVNFGFFALDVCFFTSLVTVVLQLSNRRK